MEKPQRLKFKLNSLTTGESIYWEQYAMELEKYITYLEDNFHCGEPIYVGKCQVCGNETNEALCVMCADLPDIDDDLPF